MKLNNKFAILFTIVVMAFGCKKNDDNAPLEIELQNEPPLSFDLIDVPDNATAIDVTPTLSWASAKNPKGSEVFYELYVSTEVNPTTILEEGIIGTSFEISDRLHILTDYYWKVVAKNTDGQISRSEVHKFTTRNLNFPNTPAISAASFSARASPTSGVLGNKLWLIAGADSNYQNDVWSSSDGINWTEIKASADFLERYNHASVVFDKKLWVIGGQTYEGVKSDVWYSSDGVEWTQATDAAPFLGRSGHAAVVFDDKIWVIAGSEDGGALNLKNDVWFSSNGIDWFEATSSAPFLETFDHTAITFDGKIWVIGGSSLDDKNKIWSSSDGSNWTAVAAPEAVSKRRGHSTTVYDNKIWVMGGIVGSINSAIWYSSDGVNWREATATVPFAPRHQHTMQVFDNKIWLIAGVAGPDGRKNDVWFMD